jgi:hypothetical protein
MNRADVRYTLLDIAGGIRPCPLCQKEDGIRYHEIIYAPVEGCKYTATESDLANAIFVPENAILLCDQCNARIGSGHAVAAKLLALKMSDPNWPPDEVVPAIQKIAALLKRPDQWIPRTVEVLGATHTILGG